VWPPSLARARAWFRWWGPRGRPGVPLCDARRAACAALSSRGALWRANSLPSASATTIKSLTPASMPTTLAPRFTCAGRPISRATMQVNDTSQRPVSNRTVALRIRALPASTRRASFRVASWVLIVPSRGKVMWCRSGPSRITPVENENALGAPFFVLNRGNPIRSPPRVPFFDAPQFANASASARHALAYTSFEF
jgi:hypothetical protein